MTMKTKLPLPNGTKEIPVSIEVMEKLGYPFSNYYMFCDMSFTQKDVDYIKSEIKSKNVYGVLHSKNGFSFHSMLTMIEFYKLFINDKKCPKNVKHFLSVFVETLYRGIQFLGAEKDITPTNFMVNRWMETCR